MNRNYILLMIVIVVLAGGLLFLPQKANYIQQDPEKLMWDIAQPTRYITTDEVAKMIIEKDPLYQLVDVRADYDYDMFSLPGAYNIPLDSLLTEQSDIILDVEDINTILYSDDDLKADQAWVITRRMGYKNIYVMKGGLNCWIRTIIQPKEPKETAPITEFELYKFRQGASIYFTGTEISLDAGEKKPLNVTRRKKETVAEGGC